MQYCCFSVVSHNARRSVAVSSCNLVSHPEVSGRVCGPLTSASVVYCEHQLGTCLKVSCQYGCLHNCLACGSVSKQSLHLDTNNCTAQAAEEQLKVLLAQIQLRGCKEEFQPDAALMKDGQVSLGTTPHNSKFGLCLESQLTCYPPIPLEGLLGHRHSSCAIQGGVGRLLYRLLAIAIMPFKHGDLLKRMWYGCIMCMQCLWF